MAHHTDSYAPETELVPQDEHQEFDAVNESVTAESSLSRPADDSLRADLQKPLLVALARTNREQLTADGLLDETDHDYYFDAVACDIAPVALSHAGFTLSDRDLEKYRALLLQELRGLPTNQALADYVADYGPGARAVLGLGDARSRSTYQKTRRALKTTGRLDAFQNAAKHTAHGVFGLGVPLPESVQERYDLSLDLGPVGDDYSVQTRQYALYALVRDLLDIVVENLTFDRGTNSSVSVESLLGVCAHSALPGTSIESYAETARHLYDLDDAISGTRTYGLAGSLAPWEVNAVFDDVTYALLAYASDAGVIPDRPVVSYDLTNLQGLDTGGLGQRFRTADGRWRFASLACTDSQLEFSLGLRLLKSQSQRASVLRNLLRNLTSTLDVRLVMLDRGFDGVADIEACRDFVGDNWLICAQNDQRTTSRQYDFTKLTEALSPGETAVIDPAGYDDLHPPTQLLGYSGSTDSDSLTPLRAFYSDIDLPADDDARSTLITRLNFVYNRRAKIETMFRLTKNRLALGSTTDDPSRMLFYYNVSVLFYNLYKLVNNTPAPPAGLELDVSQTELLAVIRNLAFTGPTQPPALTALIDDQCHDS